jgi:NADH:ubiquinone oxidoreductase subunit F (NADH-binding)
MGSPLSFDVRLVSGRGSYVCGEETALLNAIEGRRAEVRVRPPYPAQAGLHGQPTVVNNIETLVNIPWVVREGADAYRRLGTAGSPGTKALCFNRGFARPGIIETEFGVSLRELIEVHAGGGREPGGLAAVAIGGPMGSILAPEEWDLALDYVELRHRGVRLGHGGIVAIPASASLTDVLASSIGFMAAESCGKCVPCAIGSRQALELAGRLRRQQGTDPRIAEDIVRLMKMVEAASLCGFGQGVAGPVIALARLAIRQVARPGPRQ